MMRRHWSWIVLMMCFVAAQVVAAMAYVDDTRYLNGLFDRIGGSTLSPIDQAKHLVGFLRDKPIIANDSSFLLPIFKFLRPTARQVAEQGGDCADRSRLLINFLHSRGIKASKWALYSDDLRPQHAVVEFEANGEKMVVDPLFGLWFPRPDGGYYGIRELKSDPKILRDRVQSLVSRAERPGAARLDWYPLDRYVYDHARTINWDKSAPMQVLYQVLYRTIGEKVNELQRPEWVEEPALMVIIGLTVLDVGILVAWLLTIRLRTRNVVRRGSIPSKPG